MLPAGRILAHQYFTPWRHAGGHRAAGWLPAVALLDEVVDQFAGGVVHFDVEGLHAVGEVVEEPDGRDGHEQAEGGGDQSFRNTAGDGADTRRLLGGDFLEGLEDAGDGSEQSDERSSGADGGQRAEASLQLGVDDSLGTLESALGGFDLLDADNPAAAVVAEFLEAGGDNFSEVGLLGAVGDLDGFVELPLLQGSGDSGSKLAGLFTGGIEIEPAVDHNGEGPDRHDEENETDAAGEPAHIVPEVDGAESDRLTLLEEAEGRRVCDEMADLSENH